MPQSAIMRFFSLFNLGARCQSFFADFTYFDFFPIEISNLLQNFFWKF